MKRRHKMIIIRLSIAAVSMILGLINADSWLKIIPFLIAYAAAGYDIVVKAARNIFRGHLFDENFLMALATIGAWALGEYAEAVAVMIFYQIGELFQSLAVGKSRRSIASLMDIRPDRAVVLKDGAEVEVFPEDVSIGELLVVRPGERIPLDGIIDFGETEIDTAALTGEAIPKSAGIGDRVVSGTVNISGLIHIKVTNSFEESTVNKILELVENAAEGKAKTERFITRFSRWYTPCVVFSALILALVPPLIMGDFSLWIHRALIFLVVSCPCALVISVPLSFFGGIGCASRKGILIKGAQYLELLSKVKIICFDKTGTLTKGAFAIQKIISESMPQDRLLELSALAEAYSGHPIAKAILQAYDKPLERDRVESVREISGKGITAVIDGKRIAVGNEKLMQALDIEYHRVEEIGVHVYIAADDQYLGCIILSDQPKEHSKDALIAMKGAGVLHFAMLTGDSCSVAEEIGKNLGIDSIEGELLPQQKVERLDWYLKQKPMGSTVAFVGDGINDAPVLARADIGIAMGGLGSDAAIEASDVVIMDDDLRKLPLAIELSGRTMAIVWQNIIFAIGIKILVMVLGALGYSGMWLAIFADVGVMVIAILNAMRCLRF